MNTRKYFPEQNHDFWPAAYCEIVKRHDQHQQLQLVHLPTKASQMSFEKSVFEKSSKKMPPIVVVVKQIVKNCI